MRWFKYALWIGAWAIWAWLGVGLYYQLPRMFGRAICTLPVEKPRSPLSPRTEMALLEETNLVAVESPPRRGERGRQVRLYDAITGRELAARPVPLFRSQLNFVTRQRFGETTWETLSRSVLFGTQRDMTTPAGAFGRLEVLSGDWRTLSEVPVRSVTIHPTKPWIAMIEGDQRDKAPRLRRVRVLNWWTGAELFAYSLPKGETFSERPNFIADRDQIVLSLMSPNVETEAMEGWLEVWTIGPLPTLDHVVDGIKGRERSPTPFQVSRNGRLLFDQQSERDPAKRWLDVYDFGARRFLSTKPRGATEDRTFAYSLVPWTIGASGQAVLRYESNFRGAAATTLPSALVEIGTGNVLWRSSSAETVEQSTPDAFLVKEEWHKFWDRWLPNLKYETRAWRSLADGRVLFRNNKDTELDLRNCNAAKTLTVAADGSVHRLPLAVNWTLLAICQAILAAPLVVLWMLVQLWKRRAAKRRLREAQP